MKKILNLIKQTWLWDLWLIAFPIQEKEKDYTWTLVDEGNGEWYHPVIDETKESPLSCQIVEKENHAFCQVCRKRYEKHYI